MISRLFQGDVNRRRLFQGDVNRRRLFQGEDAPMHRCSSDANTVPVHTVGIPNTIAADQTFCCCLRD